MYDRNIKYYIESIGHHVFDLQIVYTAGNVIIIYTIYKLEKNPSGLSFCFILESKWLSLICSQSLLFVVTRCTTHFIRCHPFHHLLSIVVICLNSLCHTLSLVVIHCTFYCHSFSCHTLSFVLTGGSPRCHSMCISSALW